MRTREKKKRKEQKGEIRKKKGHPTPSANSRAAAGRDPALPAAHMGGE
jgi:hypothetical protein